MWNNIISFYIFFKKIEKIRLELSHKGKKQTLCENPTLNAIQSLLRSKINQQLLWDLYASIARDAKKNQWLLWELYAGIATNVIKTQRIPWINMRVLQRMKNVNNYSVGKSKYGCRYCNETPTFQLVYVSISLGIASLNEKQA
jgi:hypothetical protein